MFLATTPKEDLWDSSQNDILLAGEWCKSYKKKYRANLHCLEYQWEYALDVYKAQVFCYKVYEKSLSILANDLNKYLGLKREKQYYRVLIGNWLIHFIHQAYDKFKILELAKDKGASYTWVLDESQYYYPYDFNDFITKSQDDLFQFQLFSQVAKHSEIRTVSKTIKDPLKSWHCKKVEKKPISIGSISVKRLVKNIVLKISSFSSALSFRKKVIIVNPYFKRHTKKFHMLLSIKSFGRIIFDDFLYSPDLVKTKPDFVLRQRKPKNSKNFSDWISQLALSNIPLCYLEYHLNYEKLVSTLYTEKGHVFFSYNALYSNVPFQFFIAKRYKYHTLCTAQHGSAYGMDKWHDGEKLERSISDVFYTFGWREDDKTTPLPMPKLVKNYNKNNAYKDILFITMIRNRYVLRLQSGPFSTKNLTDHVDLPIQFLSNLQNLNLVNIRHHPVHDIRKWNNRERLLEQFPKLREENTKNFYDTLEKCKLLATDHFGTSFLESMQANTPTVCFLNKSSYLFRNSFTPYLKDLEKTKIVFFDGKAAAKHINEVYNNLNDWWFSEAVQLARQRFVDKYASTSENWMNVWIKELFSVVEEPK